MHTISQWFRSVISTNFDRFEHVRPIRTALVILVVLVITFEHRDAKAALPLGIGMLFAALADHGVSFRRRMTSMIGASVAFTLGTLIGSVVSANPILHIAIAGLVAAVCGLVGVAGVPSMTAGVYTLVTFTIFAGSPIDLLDTRTNTQLMAVGACLMMASVLIEFGFRLIFKRVPHAIGEMPTESFWARSKIHLHLSDQFVLHSIRLSGVIMVATILEELMDLPHAYWIPMTVAWISRPDRDGTVEKVTLRVVGTLIGVAVAGTILSLTPATRAESIVLIALGAYLLLSFLTLNYAFAVTGITIFVFFLFHEVGYPLDGAIRARVISTFIAAALVLIAIRIGSRSNVNDADYRLERSDLDDSSSALES